MRLCILCSHSRHYRCFAFALPAHLIPASTFLPPFPRRGFAFHASSPAFRDFGTMKALTPASVHLARRSLRFIHFAFRTSRPQPRHAPVRRYFRRFRAHSCSGLRLLLASSPLHSAESGSLSYGLPFRFWLLPTPPRDDAVTFSYIATTYNDTAFHRADKASSRTH